MTPEEVRVAAGFRPWFEYAAEVQQGAVFHLRRTGRTTQALVETYATLSEGRSVFFFVGLPHTQHVHQILDDLRRRVPLTTPEGRLSVFHITAPWDVNKKLRGRARPDAMIFDHTVDPVLRDDIRAHIGTRLEFIQISYEPGVPVLRRVLEGFLED